MTATIIISAVICFFVLLLFLPISVRFSYRGEARVKVKYAGITVFNTAKPKAKKKNKKEEQEKTAQAPQQKKKENFFVSQYKRLGFTESVKYFADIAKEVLKKLLWFVKKMHFKMFLFDLSVATDNAHDTAVQYGIVCTAVYPVLSVICSNAKFKAKKINVSADFCGTEYVFKTDLNVSVSTVYAIAALISFAKMYYGIKNSAEERKS